MTTMKAAGRARGGSGTLAPAREPGLPLEPVTVRIFGPLTITRGGASVPLRSAKQRRLLALLALHPGRPVPHEEIVRTLWDDAAPNGARNLLYSHVSRLRTVVGTGIVVSQPGCYRLELPAERLDLLEFDALAGQGSAEKPRRPQLAFDLFGRALHLAHGAVLADLAEVFAGHPALLEVAQRRVAVALAHADCAMRLGLSAQAVPVLRTLFATEPLHEGLAARLIAALAESGRRDAASELYARVRVQLRDELGVDPGRELATIRTLILDERTGRPERSARSRIPSDDERRSVPAQLPVGISGFVGRSAQLDELDRHLLPGPAASGLAVISGAGGCGKTQLAVRWARRSVSRFPDGQLFLDLRGHSHQPPVAPLAALGAILRALGLPADRIPGDLDEAVALFRAEAADRRLLIVLDNARDPEQIRPLIPGSLGSAVLVTSREPLYGLVARNGAWDIAADELSIDEAVDLLGQLLGNACTKAQAQRLARACGCLPLALRIAAAFLGTQPADSVEAYVALLETDAWLRALDEPGDPDPHVRAAFQLSYDALSSPEQELFRLLGLVPGSDFGAGAAAALAGIGLEEAEQRLQRLCAANLVHKRGRDGRYALHSLLQAYARDSAVAAGPVEAPAHRLAAWYLAAVRAACQAAYPHALRLPDEPPVPVRGSFADTGAAQAWLDAEYPNITAVIEHAADHGAPGEAWRLAFAYRPHLMARWLARPMLEAGITALSAAREGGDRLGEAAAGFTLALAAEAIGDLSTAARHLHRSAKLSEVLGWGDAQGVALNNLGVIQTQSGRLQEAAEAFRHNIRIMREAGNKDGEALALTNLGLLLSVSGRPREGVELMREALRIRALIGPRAAMVSLHTGLGAAYRDLGQPGQAREQLFDAVRIGRETGERYFTCVAEATLIGVACDVGEYAEAQERLDHAWQLVEIVGLAKLNALTSLHAGWFDLVQGRAGTARGWYERVLSYGETAGDSWHSARALIGIAACERAASQAGAAVRAAARALRLVQKSGHRVQIADAHLELAQSHAVFGRRARALAHARIGAEMARESGYRAGQRTAEQVLAQLG
ncbi:AfsR/SARP family transcriptional regulator [Actinospica robiniae]|uniref:AfsR/SARP family transcriptional regulator n=1 Tax=Actinospica robiniae TaxID=304901 RepID=UPI00041CEC19|nr:BTAD domain-containing putative transcriptional regulator [Actinospica robiniae]